MAQSQGTKFFAQTTDHPPSNITLSEDGEHSQYTDEYLLFMRQAQDIQTDTLLNRLTSNFISYTNDIKTEEVQLEVYSPLLNMEIFKMMIKYGSFTGYLTVLNVAEESKLHQTHSSQYGGFGNMFKVKYEGIPYAIKCVSYTKQTFQPILKNTLKQYFLLKIASILKVGPALLSPFGFDLIIYPSCIQFSMEFCQFNLLPHSNISLDLKKSLKILHSLQIIHFDIKPENINFSKQYQKYVFLDFGLSKFINQLVGHKSNSHFRGSLSYCSPQMQAAFYTKSSHLVDVYYHDAYCLRKSLFNIMQAGQFYQHEEQAYDLWNRSTSFELYLLKWKLYRYSTKPSGHSQVIRDIIQKKLQKYAVELQEYLRYLPEFRYKIWLHGETFKKILEPLLSNESSIINQETKQKFQERYYKIKALNDISVQDFHQRIFERQTKRYSLASKISHFIKILNFIRNDQGDYALELKKKVAENFIYYETGSIVKQQYALRSSLQHILDFIRKYQQKDSICEIIGSIICPLLFYEVKPQAQTITIFKYFIQCQISPMNKLKIILKCLTSIKWIQENYESIYIYEDLQHYIFQTSAEQLSKMTPITLKAQQSTFFSVIKNITDEYFGETSVQRIQSIINSVEWEILSSLDLKILRSIFEYVCLRQLEYSVNQKIKIQEQLLNNNYQLVRQKLKKCKLSVCIFSQIRFVDFNLKMDKHTKLFSNAIQKVQQYPEIKNYSIYLYQKLQNFQAGKVGDQQMQSIFSKIMKSPKYMIKNIFLADLIKLLLNRQSKETFSIHKGFFQLIINSSLCLTNISDKIAHHKKHRHKLPIVIKNIDVMKNFVCIFWIKSYEQKKKWVNDISNDILSVLQEQSCLKCKVESLIQLKLMQIQAFPPEQKNQRSLDIYIQMAILSMKHQQMRHNILNSLSVMIVFIRNTKLNALKSNLISLYYQFIKKEKNYQYFFLSDMEGQERLKDTYLYLLENDKTEQLTNLISFLLSFMYKNSAKHYSLGFYNSINGIISSLQTEDDKQLFFDKHINIINYFKPKSFNPFIGLYFSILLPSNHRQNTRKDMFIVVSKSINLLPYCPKRLILSSYYLCYLLNFHMKSKKSWHLQKEICKYSKEKTIQFQRFLRYQVRKARKINKNTKIGQNIAKCLNKYLS